jgi:subtilisin family serine protease
LGLWSLFLGAPSAYAEEYVALFPLSSGEAKLGMAGTLRSYNLTDQARETLPHLQGALVDLSPLQKEELLRDHPELVLISGSRRFHHHADLQETSPRQGHESAQALPWHVAWARNAQLGEGIPDVAWGTVAVAVMDTGVNPHRDFEEASILWNLSYNSLTGASGYQSAVYDDQGHGTAVTGVIVGSQTGVAPKVSVIPIKCADSTGNSSTADLARSVDYLLGLLSGPLTNRHLICNFSFATSGSLYRDEEMETFFHNLFERIRREGGLFLSAAGNSSLDVNRRYVYPSRVSSAIFLSVASTNESGFLAESFSNYGSKAIDVAAPGNAILTTSRNEESLETLNGTSFSSPITAGVAAALWAREQGLANWQIRNVLLNSVNTPLWTSGRSLSSSGSVAVIAGGDMTPGRFLESSFIASTKGTTPKALNLLDSSEGDSSGGCSTGTPLSGALILIPLFWGVCKGRKNPINSEHFFRKRL